MFGKKCSHCNRKIEKDFDFCPYCGTNLGKNRDKKDYGFLGKDDFLSGENLGVNLPGGFDKIISSLMNQLDGQMRNLNKEIKTDKKIPVNAKGISISISMGGKAPEIKVSGMPGSKIEPVKEVGLKNVLSSEKAKEISKLPREEARTSVRRMTDKVIYEIDLPGVQGLNNLLINKLENSIEIKAFAKNKVYVKLIPLNLPLINYHLENEKLVLEFKTK